MLTEIRPVEIGVPRDTESSSGQQIGNRRQRRLAGTDVIILSLKAKGLTTGEVAPHFADIYGAMISKGTIFLMTEWCNWPLDAVSPAVFIDAIKVKVRDGQVSNRPIYVAVGFTSAGERDILGFWVDDGDGGAKFLISIHAEIKNRGTGDVCIVVCAGLRGLAHTITAVWDSAIVQTCAIPLLPNTFRYSSRKYRD